MKYQEKIKTARQWARSKGGVLKKQKATINGCQAYCVSNTDYENWTLDSIIADWMV